MLRLVLICVGIACVVVLVGLPLLAAWAMAGEDRTPLDPGDVD
jgi:hypothetical protein